QSSPSANSCEVFAEHARVKFAAEQPSKKSHPARGLDASERRHIIKRGADGDSRTDGDPRASGNPDGAVAGGLAIGGLLHGGKARGVAPVAEAAVPCGDETVGPTDAPVDAAAAGTAPTSAAAATN